MLLSRRTILQGIAASAMMVAAPGVLRSQTLRADRLSGDGSTNDLPILEGLIKEAERRGKGTIELPPGRFLLVPPNRRSAIILPANVNLRGAGGDRTVLLMAPGITGHVVNATFGYSQISDLTIDGNEALREGAIGHGLRIGGDKVMVERVRIINTPSYGLAISQKNYARNIVIKDVQIENAGADGIDIKNRIGRTADVLIEDVTVTRFGRPDRRLDPSLIGTRADKRSNKAAVDLRGRCEVRNLTVNGILRNRDGLRFRPGEGGEKKNLGAHGSKASGVIIRANPKQTGVNGIAVTARDVEIANVDIDGADVGITVTAANVSITGGRIKNSRFALNTRENKHGNPSGLVLRDVEFEASGFRIFETQPAPRFENCTFTQCKVPGAEAMKQSGAEFTQTEFDESCGTH